MNKLIEKLITSEYEYITYEGYKAIFPYSFSTDKYISDGIEELFENNKLGIDDWDVDGETLFNNPSYTAGYVVASWIENGLLQTYHIVWEMR